MIYGHQRTHTKHTKHLPERVPNKVGNKLTKTNIQRPPAALQISQISATSRQRHLSVGVVAKKKNKQGDPCEKKLNSIILKI